MGEDLRVVMGRSLSGDVVEIGPGSVPFPVAPGARVATSTDRPWKAAATGTGPS
jgi:hypothetical protein